MLRLLTLTLLFALFGAPATAGELRGTCSVAFAATSTLHNFDGTAACTPFVLTVTEGADGVLRPGDVVLSVPLTGMRTGIDRRDRTMREMFEAERFPQIVGRLIPASLAELRHRLHTAAEDGTTFPLLLRIRDREQSVAARVTRLVDDGSGLAIELQFPLSLVAYGLKAPTVMGFIRVGDEVRVTVSVQLAPLPTPWRRE